MSDTVVIVPCYNERERFDARAFENYDGPTGFLFVNDGSTDTTGPMLDELSAGAPKRFAAMQLASNVGKAEAVRAGIARALADGAEFVGYWDSDLATPLEEIDAFRDELARRPEVTAVMGSRVRRLGADVQRSAFRHYPGRVFATLASMVLDLPVYDTQCGAKMFRATDHTRAVFAEPFLSRWVFDVEILARFTTRLRAAGEDPERALLEHPLAQWHDVPGSKLGWRDAAVAVADLWAIRRRLHDAPRRTSPKNQPPAA